MQMPTTVEHTKILPTTFDKHPNIKYKMLTTIDVIKINLMIYSYVFQVIYNFHKHLNAMYTDNKPLDHFVDHAIEHIKYILSCTCRILKLEILYP